MKISFREKTELNIVGTQFDLEMNIIKAEESFLSADKLSTSILQEYGFSEKPFALIGREITNSIGHTAMCLALRTMANDLEPTQKKYLIASNKSANMNYLHYWEKYFVRFEFERDLEPILEYQLWPFYENVSSFNFKNHVYPLHQAHDLISRSWEKLGKESLLTLSDLDREKGQEFLLVNLPSYQLERKFVTLHVRNSDTFSMGGMDGTSYGRNAHISSYLPTIRFLISQGISVVRIGDGEKGDLPSIDGLFDYANYKSKNDVYNTFFLSECEFLIGTNSGPICVPSTFGKRVLMTNAPSIGRTAYFQNSLMIPKLVSDSKGRILTLEQMFSYGVAWSDGWLISKGPSNLVWRDNTEDEILSATKELMGSERVESSTLRNTFENIIRSNGSPGTANISHTFLERWMQNLG